MIKNNFRILKKPHANLQTIAKAPVKFQKDWPKTVGGVEGTRYLLKIWNHALRTTHYRKPKTMSLRFSSKRRGTKSWRHHFPHYKSMGAFCCHGYQSFDPICPKTLCSLSLTPMLLHIKFDQDWPTGFRDIQVQKCEIFVTQGQVTPK